MTANQAERPPVELLAARMEEVRRRYGLGRVLPPEVSLLRPVPLSLPLPEPRSERAGGGRGQADDELPHAACGRVAWVRRPSAKSRVCVWCETQRHARLALRRRQA